MFRITLDIFSGRPNPNWTTSESEASDLVRELSKNRGVITDVANSYQGLGFRGAIIECLSDTLPDRYDIPHVFRIAGGRSDSEGKAQELAERMIHGMSHRPEALDVKLDSNLEAELVRLMATQPRVVEVTEQDRDSAPNIRDVTCYIERGKFNPDFWNGAEYVSRNNCYNYASNKRTNTFAQPGKGSGHPITVLSCADVTRAALSDGLKKRYDCFPDSEKPRWLVALVVAPNYDYHWYRIHTQDEGFWGHKPGGTPARNTDNNGVVVTNPETCARLPYTDFCGYFYVPKSQLIA
jgi:hypothetical protein